MHTGILILFCRFGIHSLSNHLHHSWRIEDQHYVTKPVKLSHLLLFLSRNISNRWPLVLFQRFSSLLWSQSRLLLNLLINVFYPSCHTQHILLISLSKTPVLNILKLDRVVWNTFQPSWDFSRTFWNHLWTCWRQASNVDFQTQTLLREHLLRRLFNNLRLRFPLMLKGI